MIKFRTSQGFSFSNRFEILAVTKGPCINSFLNYLISTLEIMYLETLARITSDVLRSH
jgi:hypothetical protein